MKNIKDVRKYVNSKVIAAFTVLFLSLAVSSAYSATLTVYNLNDSGAGSLRGAINTANSNVDADTVNIIVVGKILLTTGELTITGNSRLTINGKGANFGSVSGNNNGRVLNVEKGANLTLNGISVTEGNADSGGGILNFGGTLNIFNSNIFRNRAALDGGGILNFNGVMNLENCSFFDNNAGFAGGGLYNIGILNLTNSTFSGNFAAINGGGIQQAMGTLRLTNTTIYGNNAGAGGGGIFNNTNSLFSRNTIIAGNLSNEPADVSGSLISQGFNLIGNATNTEITGDLSGNILNQEPKLAPLGFYGGTTMTHALLSSSPAINSADTSFSPASDQRGAVRIFSSDIGAFELNNSQNGGTFVATLPNATQTVNYNQAIVPNSGSFTYSLTSGTLPNGLLLASNLVSNIEESPTATVTLSGTPTQDGTFNFAITASNGVNSNVTNYRLFVFAQSAANAGIEGRVTTANGRPIRNVTLIIEGGTLSERKYARTNSFGYYRFQDLEVGQTYIVSIAAKRFTFADSNRVITLNGNLDGEDFVSEGK